MQFKNKWLTRYNRFITNPRHFLNEFYYFKISGIGRKKKTQSLKYFFNELVDFIVHYDVNSMKLRSEYIWPYIRNHIWIQITFVSLGKSHRKFLNPIAIQNAHYKQVSIELRKKLKELCNANEIDELEYEKNDFLFFVNTNSSEEISVNSKIYHRIIDPIFEIAKQIGNAQKIEIVKSVNIDPHKWKKYFFKSKLIFLAYREAVDITENFVYDKDIFPLLKKYIPSIVLSDEAHLFNIINYELHVRGQYINLLKKLNPKVICLHGFHYQAPLISAAHELGILTVDLQHGIQVGWNPLYNNHNELPDSGYQAYPDIFAVWGEKEYNNILKTFHSEKHRPVYMGNPWLKRIEDFSTPLSKNIIDKIDKFQTKILIIMQNQTSVPQLFLDIIEETSDDVLWIIRHHPKGERYKAKDFSKTKNILIDDEIDMVLFNELFKHTNIAISEGSSLAVEASYFGVHNIIISEMGKENYYHEIENEIFYYLENANDFKMIMKKIQNKKNHAINNFKDVNTKDFLENLLEMSNKKIR